MRATLCERTFALGRARYRLSTEGQWLALMWGWWSEGEAAPSSLWMPVATCDVPPEVLQLAAQEPRD